jgi:hypothetical protein
MGLLYRRGTKRWQRVVVAALTLLVPLVAGDARGQPAPAGPSPSDFEVYIPKQYDRSRRWPILFVLDTRGRASLALDIFKPAA